MNCIENQTEILNFKSIQKLETILIENFLEIQQERIYIS